MADLNNITPMKGLPPFLQYFRTIGIIPASYKVTMTYEEQVLELMRFIRDEIIPKINENVLATQELQEKFKQLVTYVDEYFENLDIQKEVNIKLDEMAKSGELAVLISQYLESQAIIGFNNVSSLANAENLADGSFAKTYGKLTYNDGKGAFYKIRTRTNVDVPDDDNIVVLVNTKNLVGEKIRDYIAEKVNIIEQSPINVKLYGVVGDGNTDDLEAIQNIIDDNPGKTIYFPEGVYGISNKIVLKRANSTLINILLDKNAVIKNISGNVIDTLFEIGYDYTAGEHNRFGFPCTSEIVGGTLDATNCLNAIKVFPLYRLLTLRNIQILNVSNVGILSDYGENSNVVVGNLKIEDCYIQGTSSNATSSIGIVIHSTDNEILNTTIDRTNKGILCDGWSNLFNNVHVTAMFTTGYTMQEINTTIGFDFENSFSLNTLIHCYNDTYATGFKSNGGRLYMTDCLSYYYLSTEDSRFNSIEVTNFNEEITKLQLVNCDFDIPSNGQNKHIKVGVKKYLSNDNFSFINCNFNYNNTLQYNDPAFCVQANNKTSINCDKQDYTSLQQNQNVFYPIAIIEDGASVFDYNVQYVYGNYARVCHTLSGFLKKDIIKTGLNIFLSLIKRDNIYYLCVSTDNSGQHKNIVLSNIMNNRDIKIFAREDLFRNMVFENVASGDIIFRELLNS